MNTKTHPSFMKLIALLTILGMFLAPAVPVAADTLDRPEPASPFGEEVVVDGMGFTGATLLAETSELLMETTATTEDVLGVFQEGGDRLTAMQNTDGGWDWPLTDNNPATGSAANTIGPIGMGLVEAYLHTSDADHFAALQQSAAFLLAKENNFSPSDGDLAVVLDELLGGTTYTDHVLEHYYDMLANGTYFRAGYPTVFYDTEAMVSRIRTNRSGSQANMAAWDIGLGLAAAVHAGSTDLDPWVAGVKAEINELDGDNYYDVIGLAGALYGLAVANVEFDPTAGEHMAAGNLEDLANILATDQIDGGGFAWNSAYVIPNDGNETVQETAYALLALEELDPAKYAAPIVGAANYMVSVQLPTGGWEGYTGSGENNELTGEALWAISEGYDALPGEDLQAIIEDNCGSVVQLTSGTFAGGLELDCDITVRGTTGTVVTNGSPAFTITADDVTIENLTIDMQGNASNAIETDLAVGNLTLKNLEITGSGANGINIGHAVNNLRILDNYIHGNAGGLYFGVAPTGRVEIQGNMIKDNTGEELETAAGVALNVEYNSWGDIAGPAAGEIVGLNVDYTPWTHAEVSVEYASGGSDQAGFVAEGQQITYNVLMDAAYVSGADFVLDYDETKLDVVGTVLDGNLLIHESTCGLSDDGTAIHFCGYRALDTDPLTEDSLNGVNQVVLTVTFVALPNSSGTTQLVFDDTNDQFAMFPTSASTNLFADALQPATVTFVDAFNVTGIIDLQGRDNDSGAVMTFAPGGTHGYGPFGFLPSDRWGAINATSVVQDTYPITVVMTRYLDVTVASGKTVSVTELDKTLSTLVLWGGDANDDGVINIGDASIIGGLYGQPGGPTVEGDINNDGVVNLFDLVLMGGNFYKTSATAYIDWTP